MKAAEFAKSNKCDTDWVEAMGESDFIALTVGQKGTVSGFEAVVLSHAYNGMYNVKTAGGEFCVSSSQFV